ncbi:uncharacterized protein BDW70DRAFT_157456 [Aspergillus foveolatus]|uniref:uncharacterized protein n=1 Tax=Aspergillus foveolatus TaxID=210207 RepID=UPI003CCD8C00
MHIPPDANFRPFLHHNLLHTPAHYDASQPDQQKHNNGSPAPAYVHVHNDPLDSIHHHDHNHYESEYISLHTLLPAHDHDAHTSGPGSLALVHAHAHAYHDPHAPQHAHTPRLQAQPSQLRWPSSSRLLHQTCSVYGHHPVTGIEIGIGSHPRIGRARNLRSRSRVLKT